MKRIIILLLLMQSVSFSISYNVGVSPPVIDMGIVEPGSTQLVRFFIVTRSDEPLLVYLTPRDSSLEFFNRDGLRNKRHNYSEESSAKWVEFLSNPVELEAAYSDERGRREINFLLNIPKDAEPGYHLITITPKPTVVPGGGAPAGAQVISVIDVNILFYVAGEAVRDAGIVSIVPENFGPQDEKIGLTNHVKNTGTVSINAKVVQKIYDMEGNFLGETFSEKGIIRPNEVKIIRTSVPASILKAGDYKIETAINFETNIAMENSTVSLYPLTAAVVAKERQFPIEIIIIVLIILIAIYYYKKD